MTPPADQSDGTRHTIWVGLEVSTDRPHDAVLKEAADALLDHVIRDGDSVYGVDGRGYHAVGRIIQRWSKKALLDACQMWAVR